jgi:hypothetical protein
LTSSLRLRSIDAPSVWPEKPPSRPSDAITRCHGTMSHAAQPEVGLSGFLRMLCPTARAHEVVAVASSPYVVTVPQGMVRTIAKSRV